MAGGYAPTKFANMEEWLVEGLIEQAAEGLTTSPPPPPPPPLAPTSSMAAPRTEHEDMDPRGSKVSLSDSEIMSAISGHPQYKELLRAHMNCYKFSPLSQVGASADLAAQMDELVRKREFESAVKTSIGVDPELDQFMVAYCNVLNAYEIELRRTFKEAIEFCKKQEHQLSVIAVSNIDVLSSAENEDASETYEDFMEEAESGGIGEVDTDLDPLAGDKELKKVLMKRYGGYIKGLTQEYLKKKKKGKLPKESRQQLLDWWSQHQDHPYPNENQKSNLAQSTGLDPKQINNWFINQRKRHWNPQAVRGESSQQRDAKSSS
ncbi:homeobox protein knotted-1-like 1 isoform X1 [Selaginella moellendorffii]|uniref:homeobox protein knotted-1-like 1 isoform X1 n=1 Tax=Selaginella moellendorffii TaxID=88036 RepID=UPI000D1C8B29|nr:homeobox protein knotted-1-like 1 isoform X1 [Selaginella moellendorffii]|eukprot:XP_024538290.1 homeobox protein knotted-1-like 1 isoform X1 [Selaginella moellendorffii]